MKDPIHDALSNAETASIRLISKLNLLILDHKDQEIKKEQELVAVSQPVLSILKEQKSEGYWISAKSYYTPKMKATHWTMQLLTELHLSSDHPAMQSGAAYMRRRMQNTLDLYSSHKEKGWPCFWGNFLKYQLHCNAMDTPEVQKTIQILIDGVLNDCSCPYNKNLDCAWGVIRALWGFAAIPESSRAPEVVDAINHGLDFLLNKYSLLKADYPYFKKIHPIWFSLNYPLFYNTDILFTLRVLNELDALTHPSAQQALNWIKSKRMKNGFWRGSSPDRRRTWNFIAGDDTVNHWVSLYALSLLKDSIS